MRQTILLFALVAVAMAVMAVAASAHCYTIGANQPASVYTSCAAPQPVVQHHAVKPVSHSCSSCGASLTTERSGAAVFPVAQTCAAAAPVATTCAAAAPMASSCAVPAGFCTATGAQRWSADLIAVPGVGTMPVPCGCGPAQPLPQGRADFQLTPQGDVLRYWVNVKDINCVNGAEIRLVGRSGDAATAPVVATLYGGSVRSVSGSGRLSRGNITCADLMGPLQGKPLSALLDAMTSGQAVVVVDTAAHPQGEIAGIPGCSGLA